MPKGIFLLIHDEIKGPQLKSSYYTSPISLPQEFISKLYMSHAGFKSSSHMEFKLSRYRSISCFTGNLDRRTKKEGILGIVFEEGESYDNLDLFLQRNLYQAIHKPDSETLELIFTHKLQNYLNLMDFLEKVEIEEIRDIFIITGEDVYKNCLLKFGDKKVSNSEMIDIYQKIKYSQELPQSFYYTKLELEGNNNIFLIIKSSKPNQNIQKILNAIKPYLEKFYYYSPEILTLFLFPSLIKLEKKSSITKDKIDENKSVLQNLKNSQNYYKEFNNYLSSIIRGSIRISPNL